MANSLFAECGGWQTGEGGVLSSPKYPSIYPSPSRCAWLLEAPVGHTIMVSLQHGLLDQLTQRCEGIYTDILTALLIFAFIMILY